MKKKINISYETNHIIARVIQVIVLIICVIGCANLEWYLFLIVFLPALVIAVSQLVDEINEIFRKKDV